MWPSLFAEQRAGDQIGIKRVEPGLPIGGGAIIVIDSGIVDHEIEPSKRYCRGNQRVEIFILADVGADIAHLVAELFDGGFTGLLAAGADDDGRPRFDEGAGYIEADAGRATGDDGDFSL